MTKHSPIPDDRNPVDLLADEFVARLRNGEAPSMQEYIDRYPEHASEIEELFPGVALLEQLSEKQESEVSAANRPRQYSLSPGHRIGDIEILREIGRGGMGVVYEAYQHSLSRAVAVKAITTGAVHSPNQIARFQREAQAAAQLHHTNIVPVFGVGEQDGTSYYVMQLIHGQGLDAVLRELACKVRSESTTWTSIIDRSPGSFSARELADVLISGMLSESAIRPVGGPPHRPVGDRDATVRFEQVPKQPESVTELEYRAEDRTEDRTGEIGASQTPRTVVRSSLELRDVGASAARVHSSAELRDSLIGRADDVCAEPDAPASTSATVADPALALLGPRYWRNIARIGVQVASGLQYAHAQGTLHRDIKPANLLLDTEGTAWIADFGLAKVLEQEDVTRTGDVVGTLRYMAPEQFRGEADVRSDLYSLGLTLYELLTLRPAYDDTDRQQLMARKLTPHDPPHPRRLHPALPRDLETIILKCLAWEPGGRYPTAGALVSDLQAFLDDRPIQARRISTAERFWRWCRRNPVVAGLSTAVTLLLMLHAALATYGYFESERQRIAAEESAREAEQLAEIQWDALNRIYATFVPDRFATPVEASADAEDESGLESETTTPVLSPQTAAMLEEMLVSFDQIASIRGTDERYLEETARANRKVGDLHLRLGQYQEAADSFQRAIARYRKLEDIRGADSETSVLIARLHNGMSITDQHLREPEKARQALRESLAILGAANIDKSDPSVRSETAATYYLLGRRYRRGTPPPQRRNQDRNKNRDERTEETPRPQMATGYPPPPPMPIVAGRTPPGGDAPPRRGGERGGRDRSDRRGAEFRDNYANLQTAIDILEPLIHEYPAVPEYRYLNALCYIELSDARLLPQGESCESKLDQAIDILADLVSEHPAEPDFLYQLSEAYEQRYYRWRKDFRPLFLQEYPGFLQRMIPDQQRTDRAAIVAAGQDLQEAVRLSMLLMQQQPNVARYAESHRSLLFNLADVQSVQGETASARRILEEADHLQQMIAARFAEVDANGSWHRQRFTQLLDAQVLLQSGQTDQAIGVLRQALNDTQPLEQEDNRWWNRFRSDLQRSIYGMLAVAYEKAGRSAEADEARREAEARRVGPRDSFEDTGRQRGVTG